MATTKPERRRAVRLARTGASGFALLAVGAAALAASSPSFQPTLSAGVVATDNSQLVPDAQRRTDVIGDLDLGVILRSHGARFTATGNGGLDFIGYARHTEPNAVLPRGALDLNAVLLERALFFDGNVSAARTRSDPLGPQSDTASTANTVSTVSVRASPYFSHEFTPTLSAVARSDTTLTRNRSVDSDAPAAPNGSTNQHDTLHVVRKPTPYGVTLDALHDDTRYQDGTGSVLRTDLAQATFTASIDNEFILGAIGGHERAVYGGLTQSDTTYGAALQWRPSKRMGLDVDAEHHYFGTGWNVHFHDRLPRTTFDATLTRGASANAATFGVNGPDSNPAALLGALLSSRPPETDADAGAAPSVDSAVDSLVETRGLPTEFSQPLQITSESAQLVTRAGLNLIHNGQRDTIYASVWYQKAEALPGTATLATATTFDSRQWGGSLGLYHRLTPDMSAAAQVDWSAIDALGARTGDTSHQFSATLSLTRRLGPRASLSCGLRHFASRVVLDSASTTTDVRENQAFAGLRVQY